MRRLGALLATTLVVTGLGIRLSAQAQASLSGVVRSREGGRPVEAALVEMDSAPVVRTDGEGRFTIPAVSPGPHRLLVRAIGFAPFDGVVEVAVGPSQSIEIELTPVVDSLAPIVVEGRRLREGRLAGFDRRRADGSGRYLTRDDIERLHPQRFSDLLRMAQAGVLVRDSLGIPLAVSQRGPKLVATPGGGMVSVPCVLRVAVDGQIQPAGTTLDIVAPEEVEGVEIYPGPATIPAEFATARRDQSCGLIIIWTR